MGKREVLLVVIPVSFLCLVFCYSLGAIFIFGESAVKIPAGTKIQAKPEQVVFLMSEGSLEIFPVSDYLKLRALDSSGQLVYTGTQVRIFSECNPEKFKKLTVTDADYRFVRFTGGNPQPDPAGKSVVIPKGTKIEKIEENLYRFHLANGETVSFKCTLTSEGHMGDCTRYTKDWKIMYTRTKVKFCRMMSFDELRTMTSVSEDFLWVQFIPESKS